VACPSESLCVAVDRGASLVAVAPLFDSPWIWMTVGIVAVMGAVGLAYWWVVPAPPPGANDDDVLAPQLSSAMAPLDEARLLTSLGIVVAARSRS
jgi:hypothetical protein